MVVYSGTEWFIESLPIQYCSLVKCSSNATCVLTSTSDDPTKYEAQSLVSSWAISGKTGWLLLATWAHVGGQATSRPVSSNNFHCWWWMAATSFRQPLCFRGTTPSRLVSHLQTAAAVATLMVACVGDHWPSKLLHAALLARTWNGTKSRLI